MDAQTVIDVAAIAYQAGGVLDRYHADCVQEAAAAILEAGDVSALEALTIGLRAANTYRVQCRRLSVHTLPSAHQAMDTAPNVHELCERREQLRSAVELRERLGRVPSESTLYRMHRRNV
jgi:hypothetical protein